ncbi:MAG: sulfatase [bacterium]|nr:sulfatase [bacterium]
MMHPRYPAILSILLLTGCLGEEPAAERERTYDLVAELPAAEVTSEVRSIEFGKLGMRQYLVAGWSRFQHDEKEQRDYLWSTGEESVLEFPLLQRRDLDLAFDCRSFNFPEAPVQTLSIVLNGHQVGKLKIRPWLDSYRLRLGADKLVLGLNQLRFRYGYTRRPSDVRRKSTDRRPLAVAWYELRFGPSDERGTLTPQIDSERSLLFIPFGVQVDYYPVLPPQAELRVADWAIRGAVGGQLDILFQDEGGKEELLTTVRTEARPTLVPLPAPAGGEAPGAPTRIARLRLRALAPGKHPDDAGVVVFRPSIWSEKAASSLAAAPAPSEALPRAADAPRRPNVILYLIDALRADRLGCYGHDRGTSPAIDAFAEEAILFENAIAQSSWTKASVASILTGLWPVAHGANRRAHELSADALTLPEILREAGYATAGFITNPNVTADFGFDQGFDQYTDLGSGTRADAVTAAVVEWLDQHSGDREPFFLYIHTIDPHDPYDPPTDYRERFAPGVAESVARESGKILTALHNRRRTATPELVAELAALYQAEIAFNDHGFGLLTAALRERALYRDALILVVSDHGEEFDEHHDFKHGKSLYVESLRVPLIIKPPAAAAPRRVTQVVQHLDILPTLLQFVDLPVPAHLAGRNLLDGMTPSPIYSYLHLDGGPRVSILDGDWKLMQRRDGDRLHRSRLFQIRNDPGEIEDLAPELAVRVGYLTSRVRRKILMADYQLESGQATISEELRESLEALGYVQ